MVAPWSRRGRAVVEGLHAVFGLATGYQDPGVADFGLENHDFALGDQFLELVSPVTDEAPVRKRSPRCRLHGHPRGRRGRPLPDAG
jgi:hypothetical protein